MSFKRPARAVDRLAPFIPCTSALPGHIDAPRSFFPGHYFLLPRPPSNGANGRLELYLLIRFSGFSGR